MVAPYSTTVNFTRRRCLAPICRISLVSSYRSRRSASTPVAVGKLNTASIRSPRPSPDPTCCCRRAPGPGPGRRRRSLTAGSQRPAVRMGQFQRPRQQEPGPLRDRHPDCHRRRGEDRRPDVLSDQLLARPAPIRAAISRFTFSAAIRHRLPPQIPVQVIERLVLTGLSCPG